MRQAFVPNFQSNFPFLGSLPNVLSFLPSQSQASNTDHNIQGLLTAANFLKEKAGTSLEKVCSKNQNLEDSITEIKQEEFVTKKEETDTLESKEPHNTHNPPESRLTMLLETMRQFKMYNPLFDYSLINGLFQQQANIFKDFNNYAANLQFHQIAQDNLFNLKPFPLKKIEKLNGVYTKEQRLLKIQYYKEKKQKWRAQHPINRGFIGRKMVAKAKPRIRGKFVKKTVYDNFQITAE